MTKALTDLQFMSTDAFAEAHVPLGGVAEHAQRFLVAGAVVRGDGALEAVEFHHHRALVDPVLVGLRRHAAYEEAPARRLHRGAGDLRVGGERRGILDRVVAGDEVGLGHVGLLCPSLTPAEGCIYRPLFAGQPTRGRLLWTSVRSQ